MAQSPRGGPHAPAPGAPQGGGGGPARAAPPPQPPPGGSPFGAATIDVPTASAQGIQAAQSFATQQLPTQPRPAALAMAAPAAAPAWQAPTPEPAPTWQAAPAAQPTPTWQAEPAAADPAAQWQQQADAWRAQGWQLDANGQWVYPGWTLDRSGQWVPTGEAQPGAAAAGAGEGGDPASGWHAEVTGATQRVVADLYGDHVAVSSERRINAVPGEFARTWLEAGKQQLLADPVGWVLLQSVIFVVSVLSLGALFGPAMVGYFHYVDRRLSGEKADLSLLFVGQEKVVPAIVVGYIILGVGLLLGALGAVLGLILGNIPWLGLLLGPLGGLAGTLATLTTVPILCMTFPLLLRDTMEVQDLFRGVWRMFVAEPVKAVTFGATVGVVIGVGMVCFGVGILVTGPVAMWMMVTAARYVYDA